MEGGNNLISLSILCRADSSGLEFMTQQFVNRHWHRGLATWDFHQGDLQDGLGAEQSFVASGLYIYIWVVIYTP